MLRRTAFIIGAGTGILAPLPPSRYMALLPSNSPAMAVATAMSDFSLGIGLVLLMYSTDVVVPLSISIYPVEMH
jgi:hypothetical protein